MSEQKERPSFIESITKHLDNNSKTAAIAVLGGLSVGTLLYKIYNALPSPHPSIPTAPELHPILGHVHVFRDHFSTLHDHVFKIVSEYDIVALKMPDFYQIYLNTPKLIEWVFTTEFNKFWKGNSQNEKFSALFGKYGEAIFVSDDAHWRFHRKIGSRMFSVRNLRDYMYHCCLNTTKSTLNVLENLRLTNGEIDINDILGRMTFDCFTSIAFGTSFDSMSLYPNAHPFGESFDILVKLLPKRNSEPLWKLKRYFNIDYESDINKHLKVIDKFTNELITKRKNESIQNITDETGTNTFDLFSLYYKHDDSLTNRNIKYIALNFIIAGRDTTRMLTSWFLYDLIMFPQVKKKVIEEIDTYNKNNGQNGINYSVITTQFKYLEAALCESLRYHPVVPFSVREARDDIIIPENICKRPNGGNYIIKKGDRCVVHHFTIAKLDRFYKDPMAYNPMRFYEKGVRTFKQGVYPFFNQKPRLCLGRDFALMEAKIFLYHLLTKYEFEMVPNQEIMYDPGIIFNMKNGLKITLKTRN